MTSRNLEAIAGVLARHDATPEMIADMANVLANTNSRFDFDRFVRAATKKTGPERVQDAINMAGGTTPTVEGWA